MAKLTIMKGLPASGKSTLAREMVTKNGNTARINRDDLRRMLFNGKWSSYKEKIVIAVEKAIAATVLGNNYNVVIDDTNLRKDIWSNFEILNLDTIEVKDLRSTSISLCCQRDRYRGTKENGRVGRAVINRKALECGLINWNSDEFLPKSKIVFCDIDDTIANLDHRVHHMRTKPKNHEAFYATLSDDTPEQVVIDWVQRLYEDHIIVMLSGRGEEYAIETEEWLLKHGPPFDFLFMRRGGDHSDDTIVKNDLVGTVLKQVGMERIAFAIDDRPRVIEGVWRKRGIKVYPVHLDRWEGTEEYDSFQKSEAARGVSAVLSSTS